MELKNNIIIIFLIIGATLGLTTLYLWDVEPQHKTVATIEKGDYVKLTGYIQDIKYKKDSNGNKEIKYIKFRDNTGGDLKIIAFNKVNKDLTNYINSFPTHIKPGDKVEVIGTINTYNGIYEIILNNINDFKVIEQINNINYENNIINTNKNDNKNDNNNNINDNIKTNIYSSKNSKTYHTNINCPYGKRIKEENKIYYNSEEEAINKGLKKCSWCKNNG